MRLQPIQKDHELCCPSCGCVLDTILEPHSELPNTKYSSLNMALLGSALDKNVKFAYPRTRQQAKEEEVLRKLINITKQYSLPEVLAHDTYKELKRKNRGFWSEKEPIKQLIKILSKDDNYIYIHKLRLIKARYEKTLSR